MRAFPFNSSVIVPLQASLATRQCVRATAFVGQSSRADLGTGAGAVGMDQQEQRRVLAAFRSGEFNVLIATSVAEEGLDVGAASDAPSLAASSLYRS